MSKQIFRNHIDSMMGTGVAGVYEILQAVAAHLTIAAEQGASVKWDEGFDIHGEDLQRVANDLTHRWGFGPERKQACASWSAEDIIKRARQNGCDISIEGAQDYLESAEDDIQLAMIDAGWDVIDNDAPWGGDEDPDLDELSLDDDDEDNWDQDNDDECMMGGPIDYEES